MRAPKWTLGLAQRQADAEVTCRKHGSLEAETACQSSRNETQCRHEQNGNSLAVSRRTRHDANAFLSQFEEVGPWTNDLFNSGWMR